MGKNENQITYIAKIVGNTLSLSKEKKTPSVNLKFLTLENCTNPEDKEPHVMYGNLWLSYKAAERSMKTLTEVLGWEGKLIKDLNEPILVGKIVEIVVEWNSDFDGTNRAEIKFINRRGGMKALEKDDLDNLVFDVQSSVDEILGNKPEETNAPMNDDNNEPAHTEDDMPF